MKKLRVTVNGVSYDVEVEVLEDDEEGGSSYGFPPATSVPRPQPQASAGGGGAPPAPARQQPVSAPVSKPSVSGSNELTSPIAGVIEAINVSVGDSVKENDPLIVIEAMKMHTNISSPISGKVKEVLIKVGDAVQQGQVLLTFE